MIKQNFKIFIKAAFLVCSVLLASEAYAQEEEAPSRIWNVKIEGNETFESLVIKNNIATVPSSLLNKLNFFKKTGPKLDERNIRRDVIRIRRFYQRRGFNDVLVNYRIEEKNKPWKKVVIFEVTENSPIRIDSVRLELQAAPKDSVFISNNNDFQAQVRRLPFRQGRRYEPVLQKEVEGELSLALRNIGFPYAQTEITASVDTAAKLATLVLRNYPGPRATFDSVKIEGEKNLPARFIRRETGIEKGKYFTEKELREAQQEVFNHHMLRFAIISIPEQPEDSTINILIRVKESPERSVQIRGGVGNLTRLEDGIADVYKIFRGQATWIHRNVRKKGERFTISAQASAIEQRLGTDYLFPWFFNTKSSVILSPFLQHKLEPSYEILRGGMTNSFIYKYNSNLSSTFSYEFTLNNENTRQSQESLPDSILSYNVSSFNLSSYYTRGVRSGRQGWIFQPFWELSGLFGEATYSFQKLSLDMRKYSQISDNLVLAKRMKGGIIYYAKQDSLPSDIRYYNGGTNSVRGWNRLELGPKRPIFDENNDFERYVPIGGRATLNLNAEFRFRLHDLLKGLGAAAFLDAGQVWRNVKDIGQVGMQYGLGGGLRYQSPIGPVRVDIAYKLNPTDEDLGIYNGTRYGGRWARWGLHFSIGQAF